MRASHYAQALQELTNSKNVDERKLVEQFVETVRANGHAHLLSKIFKSFQKIREREERRQTITVTGAKALSQEEVVKLLKKELFKHALSPSHKKVARKTDETLVGGVMIRAGDVRVDASHKRGLLDFYQSLIST